MEKDLYPVIPAGFNQEHFEIFDIKRVSGSKFLKETEIGFILIQNLNHLCTVPIREGMGTINQLLKIILKETGYDHFVSLYLIPIRF